MNKIVKHYYDLAFDYHLAATTLWIQIIATPYIYNPTIYLLRHTAELLLKGLIVQERIIQGNFVDVNSVKIKANGSEKNINATHSLFDLWEDFKFSQKQNSLIPVFNKEQEIMIDKTIRLFSHKDNNSTTFRYPYNKHGKSIIIEPIVLDNSNVAPELGTTPPKIIQQGTKTYIIKKGAKYLITTQEFFDMIELLFQFYGF